jgi:hypothetical protein
MTGKDRSLHRFEADTATGANDENLCHRLPQLVFAFGAEFNKEM